jgi:hypothetical protein
MADPLLDVCDNPPGVGLVPAAVQLLGGKAELHNQVAGEVLWVYLAAFFAPQPQQSGLIVAHDDPGVRAADEVSPGGDFACWCHSFYPYEKFRNIDYLCFWQKVNRFSMELWESLNFGTFVL